MNGKVFNVCAMFGLQSRLQFSCNTPVEKDGVFDVLTEIDNSGCIVANGGLVSINPKMQRIGISYGPWSFALDIITQKEVDGNYHFKCATDLCRVDLYVCEQNAWKEKGETIFF